MAFGILVTFTGKVGKENFISFVKDGNTCKESKVGKEDDPIPKWKSP